MKILSRSSVVLDFFSSNIDGGLGKVEPTTWSAHVDISPSTSGWKESTLGQTCQDHWSTKRKGISHGPKQVDATNLLVIQ
jgi:hypothetical protein